MANNSKTTDLTRPEDETREYKLDLPEDKQKYLKTAVAFANGAGGEIVFGVRDYTREVVGFDKDEAYARRDAIVSSIFDACAPSILPQTRIEAHAGRFIIVISIPSGKHKPYYIEREGVAAGTYIRVGSQTRRASFETVQELMLESSNRSYDQLEQPEIELSAGDVDAVCARLTNHARLRDESIGDVTQSKAMTVNQLISLKLLYRSEVPGMYHPSNGLLLLSGQLDLHPNAFIQCAVFSGTDRAVFLDKKDIRGPIDQQVEDATKYVLDHIDVGSRIDGPQRRDFYELPVGSVREMIANAVAHRSFIQNGCVQVALYDDRLEVTSPGRLSPDLTLEDLKEGNSRIRNTGIAEIFRYLHLIERWGTGIPRIYRESSLYKLGDPRFTTTQANFRVELFRRPFETDSYGVIDPALRSEQSSTATQAVEPVGSETLLKKAQIEDPREQKMDHQTAAHRGLSSDQCKLLAALRSTSAQPHQTYKELANRLDWSVRKVQYHMDKLIALGLIERQGTQRNGGWVIKSKQPLR